MSIINYLEKKVQEVTAPREWQSSPESPPTKLAYITQPEIDMLVKANIHGSMKGKPNKGPEGIMSLDGGGKEEAYSEKVKNFKTPSSRIDTSKQSGRDERQEFRDRTSSTVVSDAEAQARIDQNDTSNENFLEDLAQSKTLLAPEILTGANPDKYGFGEDQQSKLGLDDVARGVSLMINPSSGIMTIGKFGLDFMNQLIGNSPVGTKSLNKVQDYLKDNPGASMEDAIASLNNNDFNSLANLTGTMNSAFSEEMGLDDKGNQIPFDLGILSGLDENDPLAQNILGLRQNNPDLSFGDNLNMLFGENVDNYLSGASAKKQLGRLDDVLKVNNPELYYGNDGYGFDPVTQKEKENLAKMPITITDSSGNRISNPLASKIAAARRELSKQNNNGRDRGLPALPPASPPITTPSPPVLPGFPTPAPTPPPTAGNPITGTLPIISGDQKTNQYTQLGIPQVAPNLPGGFSPGNFGDYYNYLNQFYNTTRR